MFLWRQSNKVPLLAVLLSSASFPLLAQGMEDISPVETNYSYARGISSDGSTVIGNAQISVERDGNIYMIHQAYRWSEDGWQLLGSLASDGSGYSDAYDISADGTVIVGSTNIEQSSSGHRQAYRWTPDGMVALGTLRSDNTGYSYATGVSADGGVVVGYSETDNMHGEAFLWTSEGMVGLGTLQSDGLGHSHARAVSSDGLVIVGEASTDLINGQTQNQAFRWTAAGMENLGSLKADGTGYSNAEGLSADGSVVIGQADTDEGTSQAFRWTVAGMQALGSLRTDAAGHSYARAISANGSVIVGDSEVDNNGDMMHHQRQAFRWSGNEGMSALGTLRPDNTGGSQASAVSADGSVIVGAAESETGYEAFLWTANGMVGLGTLRTDGSGFSYATDVSADGTIVVGQAEADNGIQRAFIYRAQAVDPTPTPVPVDPEPTPVDPTPTPVPVDPEPTPVDPTPTPVPVDPEPTPVDPTPTPIPVDPEPTPVDPTPTPVPVDPEPTPVDPTPTPVPVDPKPTPVDPTPPGTMLDLENTQTAIVQAVRQQEQTVQNRNTALVTLLGTELDLMPLARPGLNGRMSTKGSTSFSEHHPFSIRLDGAYRTGGDAEDILIAGATAATPVSPRLTLGGSLRKAVTSDGDAMSIATYLRSREADGTGVTWRGALGYSFGDVALVRDNSLSNTEVGEGETEVKSYAATAELGYGIAKNNGLLTPYVRLTHSKTDRRGYSEDATADFPVTYDDYSLTTTTITVGADGRHELSGSSVVRFGAGIEFDLYRSDDMLTGTSRVPGLEAISIDAPAAENEARPYLSVGYTKALDNGSTVTMDIGAQTAAYSSQPTSYVAIGYQMQF